MKQLVCFEPGTWEFQEIDFPKLKSGFAILKIRRIGICGTDLHAFEGTQPFFSYPRVLGHELAGEIVDIEAHSAFQKGDLVTIVPYYSCGTCRACETGKTNCCTHLQVAGVHVDGGMSEYFQVPIRNLMKDSALSLDELALVEPLSIGAHGIRRSHIKSGDRVLVVGAGPIGLGAAKMAQIAGADVILMDVNDQRLSHVHDKWGISLVINPLKEDVLATLKAFTNDQMPEVVIDATGSAKAIENSFPYMSHGGIFVLIGLQLQAISFSHPEFHKREGTLMSSRNATKEDFQWVMNSMKSGQIQASDFISHRLAFDQVPAEFSGLLDPQNRVIKAMISMD
jgi:2-desacetyl-2-hydroxyethyl bacteriochlorophyllide A dehydrogenase